MKVKIINCIILIIIEIILENIY